jgi:hypothetical protein
MKTVTGGLMFAAGDVISQGIEKKEHWDCKRTLRMTVFGTAILGFAGGYWYKWLDHRYEAVTLQNILKKVALDQLVFAPPFYASFYLTMALMQGESLKNSLLNMKKNFLPTYAADLMIWPATQAFNFKVLSPDNRILFISAISIGWNAFLSHVQHNGPPKVLSFLPLPVEAHNQQTVAASTPTGHKILEKDRLQKKLLEEKIPS